MDRIEMFGNIAHDLAVKGEKEIELILMSSKVGLGVLVEMSEFLLKEMDDFIISKDETEDAAFIYMNNVTKMAILGMIGNKRTIGIETTLHKIANQMVDTYKRKNADYGDSFGASLDKYGPVAAHVRMSDKINRLQSLVVRKQTAQVKDESIADTFLDLACYAIMRLVYIEMKSAEFDEEKEAADE